MKLLQGQAIIIGIFFCGISLTAQAGPQSCLQKLIIEDVASDHSVEQILEKLGDLDSQIADVRTLIHKHGKSNAVKLENELSAYEKESSHLLDQLETIDEKEIEKKSAVKKSIVEIEEKVKTIKDNLLDETIKITDPSIASQRNPKSVSPESGVRVKAPSADSVKDLSTIENGFAALEPMARYSVSGGLISGGSSKGLEIAFTESVLKDLTSHKFDSRKSKDFFEATKKGVVAGVGQKGIKKIVAASGEVIYEIKIIGKGENYRIYGCVAKGGFIIFHKLGPHEVISSNPPLISICK